MLIVRILLRSIGTPTKLARPFTWKLWLTNSRHSFDNRQKQAARRPCSRCLEFRTSLEQDRYAARAPIKPRGIRVIKSRSRRTCEQSLADTSITILSGKRPREVERKEFHSFRTFDGSVARSSTLLFANDRSISEKSPLDLVQGTSSCAFCSGIKEDDSILKAAPLTEVQQIGFV